MESLFNKLAEITKPVMPHELLAQKSELYSEYFKAVTKHDYSYSFSEDMRWWEAGLKSEKHIKNLISQILETDNKITPKELLELTLSSVKEGYKDGLTHRVITSWFSKYNIE